MPAHQNYDVVIVGGAMMGSSLAWWLTQHPDFDGRLLVVERDPTYEWTSTVHTNSCIRQQFSSPLNIAISQFGAEFIHGFRDFIGDAQAPKITLQSFGYLYLAADEGFAASLRAAQQVQAAHGAATQQLSREEIAARYPFYNRDDVIEVVERRSPRAIRSTTSMTSSRATITP